jgi:hypothetical protein
VRRPLVQLGRALAFEPAPQRDARHLVHDWSRPCVRDGDDKSLSIGQGGVGLGPRDITHRASHPRATRRRSSTSPPCTASSGTGASRVAGQGRLHTPAGRAGHARDDAGLRVRRCLRAGTLPGHQPVRDARFAGNELAAIPDDDLTGIWKGLMLGGEDPEYRELFEAAYPGTRFQGT